MSWKQCNDMHSEKLSTCRGSWKQLRPSRCRPQRALPVLTPWLQCLQIAGRGVAQHCPTRLVAASRYTVGGPACCIDIALIAGNGEWRKRARAALAKLSTFCCRHFCTQQPVPVPALDRPAAALTCGHCCRLYKLNLASLADDITVTHVQQRALQGS